jgi:vancomycin resistance protein VanJ
MEAPVQPTVEEQPPAHRREPRTVLRHLRLVALGASLGLLVFMTVCYAFRPDVCAAVTVWPAWIWSVVGLLIAASAFRRKRNRPVLTVAAFWAVYLLTFSEEVLSPLSLIKPVQSPVSDAAGLRIVSLNCAGGDMQAALEVGHYSPNIVLLQESPSRREVEEVGRKLFGSEAGVLYGIDASILVRGKVEPRSLPISLSSYFVQARVTVKGMQAEVFCTRLLPAVFREDLWSPSCWTAHAENRRVRRQWLRPIAQRVNALPADLPIVLGGDFNAAQGDAVFRLLQPHLRDTFAEAGTGWGNTITNDMPFLRIDQVWVSRHFRARSVMAYKTVHSDHRMVVCDLVPTR